MNLYGRAAQTADLRECRYQCVGRIEDGERFDIWNGRAKDQLCTVGSDLPLELGPGVRQRVAREIPDEQRAELNLGHKTHSPSLQMSYSPWSPGPHL